MPKIKATLRKLKSADVDYVSLVDRAANRIPFRIVKKESEDMHLNLEQLSLQRIMKGESVKKSAEPQITGIVVATGTDEQMTAVTKAIKDSGFDLPKVTKNEDGTTSFATDDKFAEDATLIRLSDKMVLVTKGFSPYNLDEQKDLPPFAEMAAAKGFYSGMGVAAETFSSMVYKGMYGSKDKGEAKEAVRKAADGFAEYVTKLIDGLPEMAFKCEEAVHAVYKSEAKPEGAATAAPAAEHGGGSGGAPVAEAAAAAEVTKGDMPEGMDPKKWAGLSDEDKKAALAKAKKAESAAAPAFDAAAMAELVTKSVAAAIAPVQEAVTALKTSQENLQKNVDEQIRKSETAINELKSTVVAPAAGEFTGTRTSKQEGEKTFPLIDTAFGGRK